VSPPGVTATVPEGDIADVPLEYSQKYFILWKNFFVVAAGLEVTSTTEDSTASLEREMERSYTRHVAEAFGFNPLFEGHQSIRKLMSPDFEKEDFMRTKFRTKKDKAAENEVSRRAAPYVGRSSMPAKEVDGAWLWTQFSRAKTEVNNVLLPALYSVLLSDGYQFFNQMTCAWMFRSGVCTGACLAVTT
jgi:hypothetical protein